MAEQDDFDPAKARIAADVLITLINNGRLKPGGVSGNSDLVIADTLKAYRALASGIHSDKPE